MKIFAAFIYLLTSKILGLSFADSSKIKVEDANIIACDSNNCEVVKQFTTSETNSFDCNEENLLIRPCITIKKFFFWRFLIDNRS